MGTTTLDHTESLRLELARYDDLYYNQDTSEITDIEYDEMKRTYLSLAGLDEYASVPGAATMGDGKIKHFSPVKSLEKVNTEQALREAIHRLWPVVIQPKLDGLTVVAYEDKYATRGTGEIGEDITATASCVEGIRFALPGQAVRMEVYLPLSTFCKTNEERIANGEKPFENARNAAAGMLRNSDPSKVKGLKHFAYNIMGSKATQVSQLVSIHGQGYNMVPSGVFKTEEEVVQWILNYDRTKLDYEIDGIVIKSDRENATAIFGETGHHPKSSIAYKFPNQGGWTTLRDVIWQTGRTGRLTPVAVFDEIRILGSSVTRATLNNMGYVEAMGLSVGSKINVVKANDVIPRIVSAQQNSDPSAKIIQEPTRCPACGGGVSNVNGQIFCIEDVCPAKGTSMVTHMARREALDIDGLGEETVDKMFELGIIKEPTDIFDLTADDIRKVPGYAMKSSQKLYKSIQNGRVDVPLNRFLYAAGMPGIGRHMTKDIAEEFGSFTNLVHELQLTRGQILLKLPGVGGKAMDAIMGGWPSVVKLFQYITPQDMPVKGNPTFPAGYQQKMRYHFVVTGTLSQTRDGIDAYLSSNGCTLQDRVNKLTDYVVKGTNAGQAKLNEAQRKNVPVITEDEMRRLARVPR